MNNACPKNKTCWNRIIIHDNCFCDQQAHLTSNTMWWLHRERWNFSQLVYSFPFKPSSLLYKNIIRFRVTDLLSFFSSIPSNPSILLRSYFLSTSWPLALLQILCWNNLATPEPDCWKRIYSMYEHTYLRPAIRMNDTTLSTSTSTRTAPPVY